MTEGPKKQLNYTASYKYTTVFNDETLHRF